MIAPVSLSDSMRMAAQPADLKQVSQAFEAIFLRRILASARATQFDDSGLFSGEAMRTFRQMQDDQFAEIAAGQGGFGLAKMIEAQLGGTR